MQDFILSEYSNVDCFMATGRNSLGKCIELLGINNEYINGNITEDFETWYKKGPIVLYGIILTLEQIFSIRN